MCGLFGEFIYRGKFDFHNSINRLNLLKHRGPDGFGFEYGNFNEGCYSLHHNIDNSKLNLIDTKNTNYFLGHRRLSIIDLNDNAFQPLETADKQYSIIFNGEIYNYIELKEELLKEGCKFNTDHPDTEALLNAYATWGHQCLEKLRGMFAFAIFDRRNQRVFIARDRIGQKTLYYELSQEKFTFASELEPLLKFTDKLRKVNIEGLCCYLARGYIPHPISFFEGIHKLAPATYALVDLKTRGVSINKYWDLNIKENNHNSLDQFIIEVDNLLTDSVSYRLRSDVPVGAFISGGIDSTLIAKKIREIGERTFDIFGADFPQPGMSEKKYIETAASQYSLNLNLSNIDISHVDNIKGIIDVFDEPFDGGSSIALFELFKIAKRNYKVILTGDGGDEMFAGYSRYHDFQKNYNIIKILRRLQFPEKIIPILISLNIMTRKANTLYKLIKGDFISNYLMFNTNWMLPNLLRKGKGSRPEQFELFKDIIHKIDQYNFSPVKALQYLELNTILPGRMLYKLDRFSMHYGVEARSPFLDHKLAELAFSIPDKINIHDGQAKIILKKLLEQDFSQEFVYRKKQGFGNPLSHWFKNLRREVVFGVLLDKNSVVYDFLNYEKLHSEFPQIKNGFDGSREKILWRLIVLGQYMENYKNIIN